ncbi:ABC transporter permease [Bacillus atrophaeus]|uniref:ABC transporter permease n=1 Tax=Bacillus atrophaeus TaxID=1452 RepID=UPI001C10BA94|nr:FtsX-like permease family protein [Bacillus atrophaeus]MBU5262771.1 FtsX-like permease family protein [Bacillus atrophaeus]
MKLNRKILRTMMENKSRYIGSVVLIIISCALYTAFNMTVPNLQSGLDEYKRNSALEDANFTTQEPITNVESLEKEYNLILEERYSWDYEYSDGVTLRILSENEKLNRYSVIEGEPLNGDHELVLDQHFAESHNLSVGDKVTISEETFTISGLVAMPDYIYPLKTEEDMAPNSNSFGVAIISKEELKEMGQSYPYYNVKFNQDNMDAFKEKLSKINSVGQWISQSDNPRITFINGKINAFSGIGKVVPIIILVLTCMLIAAVLSRLLKGEYVQIGTLFGLGYTKGEILKHYLMYSIIVSLVGSIIGTFVGQYLAKPLMMSFTFQYNLPNLDIESFILKHVIISLLLPLFFLVPVTFFVVRKALWLTPQELMRGKQVKTKISWFERSLKLNRFSFEAKFRIRDMVRSIPRVIMMILGITFASMLLLMGFTTKDSIDHLFNHSLKETFNYEHYYIFKDMQFSEPVQGEKLSISPFEVAEENADPYSFSIYGIEEDAKLINLTDDSNNPLEKDQVIVTKSLANNLGLAVGDTIEVENKLNAKESTLKIDAIADTYAGEYIFLPLDEFNQMNDYPDGSYNSIMSERKLQLEKDSLLMSQTKDEVMAAFEEAKKPVKYMVGGVSVVAFILGLIIIFMITSMMIEENKTNISLLKVLGYPKRKIYSLVLSSNVILVVIGFIIAVPLILLSVDVMFQSIAKDLKMTLPAHLNKINIFIGFVIIYLTYTISNLLARKRIMSISMAEVLKNRVE